MNGKAQIQVSKEWIENTSESARDTKLNVYNEQ